MLYPPTITDKFSPSMSEKKQAPASARKPKKRKPKDHPKRPLSAYNIFFSDERRKIVKATLCMDDVYRKSIDPDLTEDQIKLLRKDKDKVSFEYVGKVVGARWRRIYETPDLAAYYESLAKADAQRYKREMKEYDTKKEIERYGVNRPPSPYYSWQQMPHYMHVQPSPMIAPAGAHHGYLGHVPSYNTSRAAYGYGQPPMFNNHMPHVLDHQHVNYMPG